MEDEAVLTLGSEEEQHIAHMLTCACFHRHATLAVWCPFHEVFRSAERGGQERAGGGL